MWKAEKLTSAIDHLETAYNDNARLRRLLEVSSVTTRKLEEELVSQREEFQHGVERLALDHTEKELNMQTRIDVSCHLLFFTDTFASSNTLIAIQKLETQQTLVTPEQISMESAPKEGRRWGWKTHLMMLEFLFHRTPLSCVTANILTVAEIVSPRITIVKEIFSKDFFAVVVQS